MITDKSNIVSLKKIYVIETIERYQNGPEICELRTYWEDDGSLIVSDDRSIGVTGAKSRENLANNSAINSGEHFTPDNNRHHRHKDS